MPGPIISTEGIMKKYDERFKRVAVKKVIIQPAHKEFMSKVVETINQHFLSRKVLLSQKGSLDLSSRYYFTNHTNEGIFFVKYTQEPTQMNFVPCPKCGDQVPTSYRPIQCYKCGPFRVDQGLLQVDSVPGVIDPNETPEPSSPSLLNWLSVAVVVILSEYFSYVGSGYTRSTFSDFLRNPISALISSSIFYAIQLGIPALWTRRFVNKPGTSFRDMWGIIFLISWFIWVLILALTLILAFVALR